MAILYRCDTCGDVHEGYYSGSRSQWEPPDQWFCCDHIHRVQDEDTGQYKHFCSAACLLAYSESETQATESR
jgi:hypothetical protein